uniref:NADH-ubiquinone oxidoreductase chain 2 n=1 Tax=Planocera reticulata TaxID=6168 RepID=A0A5S9KCS6_9PLAT|nr:NADH dehydrogenase subunit 2 [Planocera reticulata]
MSYLNVRFLPNIWGSTLSLFFCLSIGLLIALFSNNIFLVWLGLEINMFGIIPFLNSNPNHTNNILLLNVSEVNVSFFYFFVQVIGSLFFAWGSILGDWYIISITGLIIKIGAAPFFWWVPSIIPRLDWLSIGVVSTIQKIPGILLFRLIFDINLSICIILSVIGFFISGIGINFSSNNIKQLMAWSSVSNMSILFILLVLNNSLGLIYFIFYSFIVIIFCIVMNFNQGSNLCTSFLNGNSHPNNFLIGGIILIFSGLPPFVSFLLKVYFLSSFFVFDLINDIINIELNGNSISYFYLLGSYLDSWNIIIIFILLIILQAVGYIKAFISLNSTGSSRLSNSSHSINFLSKHVLYSLLTLYIISIILIWL